MTVEYTTQHSDLYESAESLQTKIKVLEFTINGLDLSVYCDEDLIKAGFSHIIEDLENHVKAIKHAISSIACFMVFINIGGILL